MNLRLKTFNSTRRLLLIARAFRPTETPSYACNFAKRLLTLLAKKGLKPSQCNSCPSDRGDLQVSLSGVVLFNSASQPSLHTGELQQAQCRSPIAKRRNAAQGPAGMLLLGSRLTPPLDGG